MPPVLKVLTGFCPQLAFGLRWYHGVIPKAVDDYHRDMDDFRNQDFGGRLNNSVWHIHGGGPPKSNMILTYSVLLSIASVASASDTDVIWGYICSYEPSVTPETNPDLAAAVARTARYFTGALRQTGNSGMQIPRSRRHLRIFVPNC